MNNTIAYVFECGNKEFTITKKIKNKAVCPECGAGLTRKKYECRECGLIFEEKKSGSRLYCEQCAAAIKAERVAVWKKKNNKEPKQIRENNTKILDEVHDRVNCIHRRTCLMTRISENSDICLTCDEYLSEFDNDEKYMQAKGCSTSTECLNGGRALT